MNWLDKIPKWIQIPLKILLPALCLFSGFLLLISDNFAEKLYLKEFRQANGFAFGLIFTITLTLILVYVIFFASKPLIEKFKNYLIKKRLINKFKNLETVYKSVLYQMYRTPTHSIRMEISNSVATYLLGIHAIDRSVVSTVGYVFEFFLQPWIIWGIESEIADAKKIIRKFEKDKQKLQKRKDFNDIQHAYDNAKEYLEFIHSSTNNNDDESDEW